MSKQEIWNTICSLSQSQGLYGRIKVGILESGRKADILQQLEDRNFNDAVDLIMFFEG